MECRKLSPNIRKAEEMTSLVQKEKLTPEMLNKIKKHDPLKNKNPESL